MGKVNKVSAKSLIIKNTMVIFITFFIAEVFIFYSISSFVKKEYNDLADTTYKKFEKVIVNFLNSLKSQKDEDRGEKIVFNFIVNENLEVIKLLENKSKIKIIKGIIPFNYKIKEKIKTFKEKSFFIINYSWILGEFALYHFTRLNNSFSVKVYKIKDIFPRFGVLNIHKTIILITYGEIPLIIYNSSPEIFPYASFVSSSNVQNLRGKEYYVFKRKIKNTDFNIHILISKGSIGKLYNYEIVSLTSFLIIILIIGALNGFVIKKKLIDPIINLSSTFREKTLLDRNKIEKLSKYKELNELTLTFLEFIKKEKKLRDEIEKIRRYYWEIINKSPDILIVMNEALRVKVHNMNAKIFFGLQKNTRISKTPLYSYLKPLILQLLRKESPQTLKGEFRYIEKNKTILYEITLYRIFLHNKSFFVATFKDITKEKEMLKTLKENIKKNELILNSISEIGIGVILYKKDLIGIDILDANTAVYKLLKIEKEGKVKSYSFITKIIEEIEDKIKNLENLKDEKIKTIKTNIRDLKGNVHYIEFSEFFIEDRAGKIATALIRDITEEKLFIEQILKEDRLKTMGILAGGVAHDFNNILGGLIGNIEIIERIKDPEKIKNYTQKLKSIIDRASSIINQILVFSKGKIEQPEALDIYDVTKEVSEIVKRTFKKKINFTIKKISEETTTYADKGQIFHSILNLLINANDAVESTVSPKITVEVGKKKISKKEAQLLEVKEGEYVFVSVEDNGTGIPDEIKDKIFDPFFTTKKKGTGLGLATIKRIIQDFKGNITLDSEIGKGSKFTIYLPYIKAEDIKIKKEKAENLKEAAELRIFIVDDEQDIRAPLAEFLKLKGNIVFTAANGKEFFDKFEDSGVDLILLDMVMPVMDGYEVLERLKFKNNSVPVVIISGYFVQNEDIRKKYPFVKLIIKKPVHFNTLYQTIKEIIEEKGGL